MANVISAGNQDNKHFLHSGFSATIDDSYSSPDATPQGMTWDGTNLISVGRTDDKHYLHSGFSSTIDDSYPSPGVSPRGITWDGTNVLSVNLTVLGSPDDKQFLHSGFSATIDDSYSAVGRGMSWDGTNVLSDNDVDKHLLHDGFSATIDDSYTAPSTRPTGLSWDGTNVLSADSVADKHYLHSGFSSTIDDSYPSPDNNPGGITWDGRYTAAVTGTATSSIDESGVRTGGDTIILTLTNTNWVAVGGAFDAIRQDIIDGLDSAQSEGTGWNAEVRDNEVVGAVVRTSDKIVTITLTARAAYEITAQETITVTIPTSAISEALASPIIAAPTFTVDPLAVTAAVSGTAEPTSTETQITAGGRTILITLTEDTWVASGAAFNAIRQDIIDGLDSAQSETLGWNAEVRDKQLVAGVVRTSPTVVTITLTAQPGYDITATETITVTVPASAVSGGAPITATPTFTVTSVAATAAISGTATATINETDVVSGGNTIIITLANGSWVAAGATFNAQRQAIIDGLDSAQVEATGWNAEVRDNEVVTAVVRTSQKVVTITLTAQAAYDITAQETITVTVPASAINEVGAIVGTPTFTVDDLTVSSAVTGTITPSSTEAQIVSGGRTIIITLTGDTWVASGATFNAQRQAIIDGLDSAQSELTGWNAEVRDKQLVAGVVRTSATIVTITLDAQAGYDITDTETITVTVPASALVLSGSPVVSTPTFTVTEIPVATVSGTAQPSSTEAQIVAGGRTVIITLADDEWVASGATFNAVRQAIIDGLDSAQSELTGWNAEVRDKEVVTAVVRTNDTVVTITLTAQAAYDITSNERITVTVPASALDQTALPITATPFFSVVAFIGPTDVDPFESIAGNGLGGVGRDHVPPGVIVNY